MNKYTPAELEQLASDAYADYLDQGQPLPDDIHTEVRSLIYQELLEVIDMPEPLIRVLTGLEVAYGAGRPCLIKRREPEEGPPVSEWN